MLKLSVNDCDIVRVSKIIANYNLNASIDNSQIIIDGKVTEELSQKICENVDIHTITNCKNYEFCENLSNNQNQEIIYPTVKRGDVYICDFGEPYSYEQAYERYAIVVQNNDINGKKKHNTTIVIPCTTSNKGDFPSNCSFYFTKENMVDYKNSNVSEKLNIARAEQIRVVSKSRLVKYLGTLTEEFMDEKIQPIIENALSLKTSETIIQENSKNVEILSTETNSDLKEIDQIQISLLSNVDIKELLSISKSSLDMDNKIRNMLNLFGFDVNKNGVDYLVQAIVVAPKDEYYNLEILSKEVGRQNNIEPEEVKRLIVARVKENFEIKKSPAISFIRLINNLCK